MPKWGYKGKNKVEENQWLVEVDDKKTKNGEEVNPRALSRQQRLERIKKNERQMKKNLKHQGSAGAFGPRSGGGVRKAKNGRK